MVSTASVSRNGPPSLGGTIVSVHALSAGYLSLPEYQFVQPAAYDARRSVPSLAFLIQHQNTTTKRITRILFDLGLRRDIMRYPEPLQRHISTRQPLTTDPDVVKSLARGNLTPQDIDYVIYSHVHWDHIGEPRDFPSSTFVVGHGSTSLLDGTLSLPGDHSFFENDLLPQRRTIELSDPHTAVGPSNPDLTKEQPGNISFNRSWKPHGRCPQTLDLFDDGSLYIVNAPGHLPGHINILARLSSTRYIYLAGDACHDRRLLTGEKAIGEWNDAEGHVCCIHTDRKAAEETIARIRGLESDGVEIVFAHDDEWESVPANQARFFGADIGLASST